MANCLCTHERVILVLFECDPNNLMGNFVKREMSLVDEFMGKTGETATQVNFTFLSIME